MPFRGPIRSLPSWAPGPVRVRWDRGSEAIRVTLKRMRTARRIRPDRRFGLSYEDLELTTADGVRLAGWWIDAPRPVRPGLAAVVHHHYGGQKATTLPWLQALHALGVPSLAIDGRGHAASAPSPPGRGSFVARREDVRAACEEARRRGARRILAVGQSQGAATTVMAVAGRADLAGVLLDSGPAPDMGTAAWGLAGNLLGRRDARDRATRALLAARIVPGTEPARYLPALWLALARLRRTPLLWLHGDEDDVIERGWSRAWFRALRPRDGRWQAIEVRGADHVRTLQVGGEPVLEQVRAFLASL